MTELKFIKEINLKALGDAILDNGVGPTDAIFLHSNDFDDIACEYRETYKESIAYPFFHLGVFIGTSEKMIVPPNEIRIERDTQIPEVLKMEKIKDYPPFETVYICGWCGNVVDSDGGLLTVETRAENIRIIEKYKGDIKRVHVNGECCPNGHETSGDSKLWL